MNSPVDTLRLNCINNYKKTLKASVPKVNSIYDGYLQNYSPKDGTLLKKIDEGKDIKVNQIKTDLL